MQYKIEKRVTGHIRWKEEEDSVRSKPAFASGWRLSRVKLDLCASRTHARFLLDNYPVDDLTGIVLPMLQAMSKDSSQWTALDRLWMVRTAGGLYQVEPLLTDWDEHRVDMLRVEYSMGWDLLHILAIQIATGHRSRVILDAVRFALRHSRGPHRAGKHDAPSPFQWLVNLSAKRDLDSNIALWLRLAKESGVDLEEYGRSEFSSLQEAKDEYYMVGEQ